MDRLYLDANVLFSAAYRADSGLSILWKLADVVLRSSRYAVEEARINLDQESQRDRLGRLASGLQLFEAVECAVSISLPEKDRPIFLAAIEARADYLLTGDIKYFGAYFGKKIEGITILLPAQYLRERRA